MSVKHEVEYEETLCNPYQAAARGECGGEDGNVGECGMRMGVGGEDGSVGVRMGVWG